MSTQSPNYCDQRAEHLVYGNGNGFTVTSTKLLLDVSQDNAMDDSGGQGFGGVLAGGVSVEERTAGGGGEAALGAVVAPIGNGRVRRKQNKFKECYDFRNHGICKNGDRCQFKHKG